MQAQNLKGSKTGLKINIHFFCHEKEENKKFEMQLIIEHLKKKSNV